MTITNRLSLFFLATLALVLAGFSASLYFLAGRHLYGQAEERLAAALGTLTAAAEVGPGGVEWEPAERRLALDGGAFGGKLVWLVSDGKGRVVDRSGPPGAADMLGEVAERLRAGQGSAGRLEWRGEDWLFRQRRLRAGGQKASGGHGPDNGDDRYPVLVFTVGASLELVQATLHSLAEVLVGLSAAVWLAALLAGRALCRRALRPVTRMAAAALDIDAARLDQRLPVIRGGDELEDLSRAFNNLLERLQESFERQRRFTGDASHQLRTPLAAMLGQVEVALRRERPAEEYRQVLTTVRRQADRLRWIVESLLFLARADAEARLPDRERLDLRQWVMEYVRSLAGRPRADDVRADLGPGPAWVAVCPVLLGELVNVLLDNACKYSPPGTPVAVGVRREGEVVELSVRDQGFGIGAEDLPHLFRPFFRAPEARRRGIDGLGLGLAIARRLAEAFGGTLTATSGVGQGSCFTLRLPEAGTQGQPGSP